MTIREASRENVLLSENVQIKIILDVQLLFGTLGSLDKDIFVKTSNLTKIVMFHFFVCVTQN